MYDIIYCDPPWDYKGQTQHSGKDGKGTGGAINHYPVLTLDKLKLLNIQKIANKNSLLFMWTSSPHLDQAIDLMKSWGFKYTTIAFVWDKQKLNPGYYTMSQIEICLVGKMGKIPDRRGSRKERQLVSEVRKEHSTKPDAVRDRIKLMFPEHRKIELFARQKTDGWDVWGNEVDKDIEIEVRNE